MSFIEEEKSVIDYIRWYNTVNMSDVNIVGGKNASLGEMIQNMSSMNIKVPNGFATTSFAFNEFLEISGLNTKIYKELDSLDVDNIEELSKVGKKIRDWIISTPFNNKLEKSIEKAYQQLKDELDEEVSFAVRSSATAEDLPDASFAGQQESFLNVKGIQEIKKAIHHVFASLFNDRAISYRVHKNFIHSDVSISAGVQQMIRSDVSSSGVMFSIDPESGFKDVVFITSSYGLGEMVVQGAVNPDEFYVFKTTLEQGFNGLVRKNIGSKMSKMIYSENNDHGKQVEVVDVPDNERRQFSLTDDEVQLLAHKAMLIEAHYKRPMDIEWAKDGVTNEIYIVQARPETVKSNEGNCLIERFFLREHSNVLIEGRAIGHKIGAGVAKILDNIDDMHSVNAGDVLVTDMTDPDWEPIMKKVSAIVTNRGGRTCHAAIIARELGIPAIVGCGNATQKIKHMQPITVSCAEGDTGYIYENILDFEVLHSEVDQLPTIPVNIMMNVGNPDRAFDFGILPNAGIGLARLEFIINRMIGIHPSALLNYDQLEPNLQLTIDKLIIGYDTPKEFYIHRLQEGIATLAASVYPKPIIVRLSDFKSNEYAELVGGDIYEPDEENPMLGFRGASRYVDERFSDCFALECEAVKRAREKQGLNNIQIMIPFVRTLDEAKMVFAELAKNGLERGKDGLKVQMMCEIPSNALLADQFLDYFDGFSIGSNDMTQLTLGLDRDSEIISHLFDERDEAIKKLLEMAIDACKKRNKYIGICGQGPSDYPDFAEWLMNKNIDSLSLNPDTVLSTWLHLAKMC